MGSTESRPTGFEVSARSLRFTLLMIRVYSRDSRANIFFAGHSPIAVRTRFITR
jgi:hypothetical protein